MKRRVAWWAGLLIWLVGSCHAYASQASHLQTLIDRTPEHGVLVLDDQTYSGNLVITKPLTIKGTGPGTVIHGDGTDNVITIKAPGVRIENLTVEHGSMSRNSAEEYAAIKVNAGHAVLTRLVIRDAYHGIHLQYADDNEVSHVEIAGQGNGEIAGQGNGIQLDHSRRNKLIGNVISGTRDGIYFYYSDGNEVTDNRISHTRYGLHYMYSDSNRFLRNRFFANLGGATIMHSKQLVLKENDFSFNQGTRAFGLMLQSSDDNEIVGNRFYQNQRALYLDQSLRNRFVANQFIHNQVGVELWASCSDQVFTQNRFFANIAPVITVGGTSNNRWDEAGKGNYWGRDLPLIDLNQDGVGDTSVQYKSSLYQLVQDNELVYLFLDSPAVGLYEKMNQLLQNQEVMLEDRAPLLDAGRPVAIGWIACGLLLAAVGWLVWQQRRRKA